MAERGRFEGRWATLEGGGPAVVDRLQPALSPDDQLALDALRSAVAEALDRKRRLGHYAVIWRDGRCVRVEPQDLAELAARDGPGSK
jgi:hypothetical protein